MFICFLVLLILNIRCSYCLKNGLALTPPMGFLSWGRYRCTTDCNKYPKECIRYRDVGYQYIVIDDCWPERHRDAQGQLQADKQRFPNGIKTLSNYMHSKGLRLGIYENFGNTTCMGFPGSFGHLKADAELFASWDIDYIKLDGCFVNPLLMDPGYIEFGRHLSNTQRKIVYSCSWPYYQQLIGLQVNYSTVADTCNLWRSYDDIEDSWHSVLAVIDNYALNQDLWEQYVGPGHWNDPDMLMLGNNGLNYEQSKTQMAIWSIMAAPLFISTDVAGIKIRVKDILQNKAVIEINQDVLGIPGKRIYKNNKIEIWLRKISPVYEEFYSYAVAIFNRKMNGSPVAFDFNLENINLLNPSGYLFCDLFDDPKGYRKFVLTPKSTLNLIIGPSDVKFYRANAKPMVRYTE